MQFFTSICCVLALGCLSWSLAACASNEAESNAETAPAEQTAPPAAQATAASLPDPCTLMAPEEITAATDLGSSTGQASTSGGARVCTWTDASGNSAIVQVYPDPSRYGASQEAFPLLYGSEVEDVQGIGDRAFYIAGMTGSLPTATVSAQKGELVTIVQVMAMKEDAAALQSAALELTQRFLQKL